MEWSLKTALYAKVSRSVSFEVGWGPDAGQFPMLKELYGRIATVFPNSTTVEADFPRLGLEKNE